MISKEKSKLSNQTNINEVEKSDEKIVQLQNDIETLQEQRKQDKNTIEKLLEQYRQLQNDVKILREQQHKIVTVLNKHILDSKIPYEAERISFSKTEDKKIDIDERQETALFKELQDSIEIFCSDNFFENANDVEEKDFYQAVSWFYHMVYEYVGQNTSDSLSLEQLSNKWNSECNNYKCKAKNFTLIIKKNDNDEWNKLIESIKKNYKAIFSNTIYELVYPEEQTPININSEEYKIQPKNSNGKFIQFCIYAGIRKTTVNHKTGESKVVWVTKPTVWV